MDLAKGTKIMIGFGTLLIVIVPLLLILFGVWMLFVPPPSEALMGESNITLLTNIIYVAIC